MAQIPEHTVTNNPHGVIIFGPVGTENDGSVLNIATTNGHHDHYNKNGNKTSITPKKSEEICGGEFVAGRKDDENAIAAKVIIWKNGEMTIRKNEKFEVMKKWMDGKTGCALLSPFHS